MMEAGKIKDKELLIELHYLPCIQYFSFVNASTSTIIDPDDIYVKQTYRNRCQIMGANRVEDLTIPVKKISGKKMLTREVEIDYNQKWVNQHTRAIQSAYGKAPFFEHYAGELFSIYDQKPALLIDLNQQLMTKCLEYLNINCKLVWTKVIDNHLKKVVINVKNEINPKKTISDGSCFNSVEYFQVFGNNFVPNLSIIDLIFCEGPQARDYLMHPSI